MVVRKSQTGLLTLKELTGNLKYLVLKTRQQLEDALEFLDSNHKSMSDSIRIREDYIDNLKGIIQHKCYAGILKASPTETYAINLLGALNTVTANLERIGDFAVNIIQQSGYFTEIAFIKRFNYLKYFKVIFSALDSVTLSFTRGDTRMALTICKSEVRLDELYKTDFTAIMKLLDQGKNSRDAVTALFILRYLERIGDSLLNIGEAIISGYVGTKIKMDAYVTLKEVMHNDEDRFFFENIGAETRSGARIEKVVEKQRGEEAREILFKEGNKKKLLQEKKKLEDFDRLMPGMVPRIYEFKEMGENAVLMLEYLQGANFQEIVLGHDGKLLRSSLKKILQAVRYVWEQTLLPKPSCSDFMMQLDRKISDVYDVHPVFRNNEEQIGTFKKDSFDQLRQKAAGREEEYCCPFSVYIHGDFNTDNIIYNHQDKYVYYIDLNRSGYADYVKDVAVFLVSNFRTPVFERNIRKRLNWVILNFYRFAAQFAADHNDASFSRRLALGLARSFATSTRFEMKPRFAREMFLRSEYLLEHFLNQRSGHGDYRIPEEVLVYL